MFILRIILLLLCFIKSGCANELGDISLNVIDSYSLVWNKMNSYQEDPDTGSHHIFSFMLNTIKNKEELFKIFLLLEKEYWGTKDMKQHDLAYLIANVRCLLFKKLNQISQDKIEDEELEAIFIVENEKLIRQLYLTNTDFLSQLNNFYEIPNQAETERGTTDDLSFDKEINLYHASFFLLNQQHIKDEVKRKANFFENKDELVFQNRMKRLVFDFYNEAEDLYHLFGVDQKIFLDRFTLACQYLYYHMVCDDEIFALFSETPGFITETVKNYQKAKESGFLLLNAIKEFSETSNTDENKGKLPIIDLNAELEVEDDQGRTPFINAVLLRHDNLYQRLLKLGANINAQDNEGRTALYLCFQRNLFSRGETLIKHGADIYIRNKNHMTVLDLMIDEGNIKGIRILLQYIEDLNHSIEFINGERYQYAPPVLYAVNQGQFSILNLLVNSGADPNISYKGIPLLCTAISKGCPEIVNFLLKHKGNVNIQDVYGNTPLAWLSLTNNFNINNQSVANLLISRKANPNISDNHQNTPLHKAVKYAPTFQDFREFLTRLDFFLKINSNIEVCNDQHQTPLLYSISSWKSNDSQRVYDLDQLEENKLISIIKKLLQAGADINAKDIHLNNCLFYAIKKQYFYVCKFLLDQTNIDVNAVNALGETCLLNVLANHQPDIANLLLIANAEVNCKNKEGETPLMIAIMQHDVDVFYQLIARHADKYAKDKHGQSVLQYLIKNRFYEGLELLLDSQLSAFERWKGVFYAHKISEIVSKTILFKNLTNINLLKYTSNRNQNMMLAINSNQFYFIQLLLDSGIDINQRNFFGQTFLIKAVIKGLQRVVDLLLRRGALCNLQDHEGNTALMYAVKREFWKIAEKLIKANADAVLTNYQHENPLMVLVKNQKYDLERLYLQCHPFLFETADNIHLALAEWLERCFVHAIQRFEPIDDTAQALAVMIPLVSVTPNAIYKTIVERDGSIYEGWVGEDSVPSIGKTGTVEGIWTQANGEFFDWYQLCAMKRIV